MMACIALRHALFSFPLSCVVCSSSRSMWSLSQANGWLAYRYVSDCIYSDYRCFPYIFVKVIISCTLDQIVQLFKAFIQKLWIWNSLTYSSKSCHSFEWYDFLGFSDGLFLLPNVHWSAKMSFRRQSYFPLLLSPSPKGNEKTLQTWFLMVFYYDSNNHSIDQVGTVMTSVLLDKKAVFLLSLQLLEWTLKNDLSWMSAVRYDE